MDKEKKPFYIMRNENSTQGLVDLINHINKFSNTKEMNMIEIGSYVGESTIIFAKHFKNVVSIDPFVNNYDPNDLVCSYADFDDVYEKFMQRTADFRNIINFRLKSDDGIKVLKRKFDFVYIDGVHTYEQVKKDIINYLPLINEDGFIGGHDYITKWEDTLVVAVKEVIVRPDIVFRDGSWLKKLSNIEKK